VRQSEHREQRLKNYVRGLLPPEIRHDIGVTLTDEVPTAMVMPASEDRIAEASVEVSREQAKQLAASVDGEFAIFVSSQPTAVNSVPVTDQITADHARQFGLVLHETLHLLKTDIAGQNQVLEANVGDRWRSLVNQILNTVEDGAMEHEMRIRDRFSDTASSRIRFTRAVHRASADDFADSAGGQCALSLWKAVNATLNEYLIYQTPGGRDICQEACDTTVVEALRDPSDNRIVFASSDVEDAYEDIINDIETFATSIRSLGASGFVSIAEDKETSIQRAKQTVGFWEAVLKPALEAADEDPGSDERTEPQSEGGDEQKSVVGEMREQDDRPSISGEPTVDPTEVEQGGADSGKSPSEHSLSSEEQSESREGEQSGDGGGISVESSSDGEVPDKPQESSSGGDSSDGQLSLGQFTGNDSSGEQSDGAGGQSQPEEDQSGVGDSEGEEGEGGGGEVEENDSRLADSDNVDGSHQVDKLEESDFETDKKQAQREVQNSGVKTEQLEAELRELGDEEEVEVAGSGAGGGDMNTLSVLPTPSEGRNAESGWKEVVDAADLVGDTLQNVLRLEEQSPSRTGMTSGKYDTSKAHRLAYGDPRVFKRDIPGGDKQYLLVLVLDRSGSMSSWKGQSEIETATEAVTAFALAAENIGIDVAVVDFVDETARLVKPTAVDVEYAKDTLLSTETGGGTPLADALELSESVIGQSRYEPLVISITDGKPANVPTVEERIKQLPAPVCSITLATVTGEKPRKARRLEQYWERSVTVFKEENLTRRLDEFASLLAGF
jgi:Mg-chelatase subunit ChlD